MPVILGMPTINRVVMSMKEGKMERAPPEWHYSCQSYEISNNLFMGMVGAAYEEEGNVVTSLTNTTEDPTTLDEKVKLTNKFTVPAFGTLIVHKRTECTMMMDQKLRVLTQATYPEDGANLPNGLYVLGTYMELKPGSHNVSIVVQNSTAKDIHMPLG